MEFPSFNHHNHNRYVPPPPNNFSDDHPNFYHHPPLSYPNLPPLSYPNLPPPPLPVPPPPPPPSYQSHLTSLDPQNLSFSNHNRSSSPPRFSNRFDYRFDSRSDPHNHRRFYLQSDNNYYKPERLIPSSTSISRFRDDNNNIIDGYTTTDVMHINDRYASSGSVMNLDKSTGYSSRNLEPHYMPKSENERIWDRHGDEDPKWVMKGKKNELRDYDYKSNKVNNRVREGREEFKQVQKKSVLLRIGKLNNTSRNRNNDQHFSKPHLLESNNTTFRAKDKDRDHTCKDSSLYVDQNTEERDRESSPVELDVSFKSNALVAKAVVTPSSPFSDNNYSQPRNRKAKRVSDFYSPLSKFTEPSPRSGSSSHGLDTPSSSEKPPKQSRDKDAVNGSLSGPVLDQGGGSGGSNGPLTFRLRKKRKLRNLGSNAFNFQLAGKDHKSVKGEENIKNTPIAPIPFPTLEEIISIEVDKSSHSVIPEKDGSEVENGDFSAENKNLDAHKLSVINDGLGIDHNQQPNENEISLNIENDTQMVSKDVKLSLGGTDISTTSGQDQIEIHKFPTESHASFDASNILYSFCNGFVKMQEISITADMNSLDSCSGGIIIVSPEKSDVQGFFDDVPRKEDESQLLEGTSKFPEDVLKESQNAVIVAEDDEILGSGEIYVFDDNHENVIDVRATPSCSFKESCSDKDEVTGMVNSISTSVQTISPDHGESGTDETYLLPKDDVPLSYFISACDNDTVAFVTDSNDKSGESVPDMLTGIVSSQKVSSFSDSQVLTSELTDKTISNLSIPMNDENICEKSVSKDGALVNGPELFLENSRTCNKTNLLEVTKTVRSVTTLASTTKLQGSNLSMTKLGSVSAVPRVFTGRSTPVFTNSRVNNPAKPRTWHRSTSNPPPPKQMGQNSYIRSGNTIVRKSAPVTAVASVPPTSRSSAYQLNPSGLIEIRNTAVNSTFSRTCRSGAPVVRPNTPPLSGSTKLPDCPTYLRDLPSSPLEHLPEDQNGTSSSLESQKTLDEGGSGKKIHYVKRKSNQLVAASTTDQPIQDILSSDGYYKRRKNQLIRTSAGDDSVNTDVPKVSKINIKRQSGKGISKKYKHLRFPSVWTLSSQSSGKDGVSLHQNLRPHLFPWKRSRNWGNVTSISASIPSNSSSLLISRKLLLSRKREMIYTRSKHGFSLRMSKLLSVGGSSLKWSKSIEKNSKRANVEATLAVAAAEQKKREQHGSSETNRDRIFRIGLVRYKMDPSSRTLQRISDEEPSTSMQSKEEMRKSYVPKRLKIGHDEYVRIGNGNQLVRNPKRRTRIFANEKVRWSLHTARLRLAKKKKYCQFFTRFGKCNKDDGKCPYIHDSSKIAVCTKFLRGSCSNLNCKLTHKVIPERMQDCSYFLQGLCSNKDCPYRHVNVNSAASICEGFLKGFCADGNECRKKHTYACPVFEATGACSHGTNCKLQHPRNRNLGLKRKQHSVEQHQKNGGGRYFGSIIGAEAMQISEKHHVKNDDEDILCQEGKFAEFIGLGFSNEEAGETMSDQRTMLVSESSGLGAAEFDDLTKPIGIMKTTVFDIPRV